MNIEMRLAEPEDLEAIVEIYNWAIQNTSATFDTELKTVESQKPWFESHSGDFSIFVATSEGNVLGWGSISPWSDRCAYSGTGEVALYVDPEYHGQGLGKRLLEQVVNEARKRNFRTLVSKVTATSESSLHLHEKVGFELIGTMQRVGKKFDRVLDVHLLQILF